MQSFKVYGVIFPSPLFQAGIEHEPGCELCMQAQWDSLISGIQLVHRGPVTPAVRTRTWEQLLSGIQFSRDRPSAAMWENPGKENNHKTSLCSSSLHQLLLFSSVPSHLVEREKQDEVLKTHMIFLFPFSHFTPPAHLAPLKNTFPR